MKYNKTMENHKKQEIECYDRKAIELQNISDENKKTDFEGLNHSLFTSYKFCEKWLKENSNGKKLLDYGCGNGVHSTLPAKNNAQVLAVDLSKESLKLAQKKAEQEKVSDKVKFKVMDCEKLDLPNNSFDIVFDGGTFSSLELEKGISEIARVLKPEGAMLAIETLGHNPIANLKRAINKLRGKRTGWATNNIFKTQDLDLLKKYFNKIDVKYFHLSFILALPFRNYSFIKYPVKILDAIDYLLLKIPFLKKYAFKIVVIASNPKK